MSNTTPTTAPTPSNNEHYELFTAIKAHRQACIKLGQELQKVKSNLGRQVILDLLPVDISHVNDMCRIASCADQVPEELLPHQILELSRESASDIKKLGKLAKEKNLRPSQLRKEIRKHTKQASLVTKKDIAIPVNKWFKHAQILGNELKKMSANDKSRALAAITNSILQ